MCLYMTIAWVEGVHALVIVSVEVRDNFVKLVLSFHFCVGSGGRTQTVRIVSWVFLHIKSYVAGPRSWLLKTPQVEF